MKIAVVDAQGCILTGWVLLTAWVQAINARLDAGHEIGAMAAYMSPKQYDWILSHASSSAISQEMLEPHRMRAWGVPLVKHEYMQDELVSIMNRDGEIAAQIKNLIVPGQVAELKRQHAAEADHTNRAILDCKIEKALADGNTAEDESNSAMSIDGRAWCGPSSGRRHSSAGCARRRCHCCADRAS